VRYGSSVRRGLVLAVVFVAGTAHADVTSPLAGGATIDWSRGMLTVTGVGLADRNAPSPAVGRAASRRRADDAARAALAGALPAVPWTAGGKPGELAARDGWLAAHAVVAAATLHPDGSWRVTLGLPIEAIRLGLAGPRRVAGGGDPAAVTDPKAPRVVVIDARPLAGVTPIGGVAIGAAGAGPTVWIDLADGAAPPTALVGAAPITRRATAFGGGAFTVDGDVPDLAGALIVVVVRTP
jgi:hypothetical protein